MITYDKFTLSNGLRVLVHHDASTPIVAMNLIYDVGSRDEDENRSGFAHLFEHLMFGGSKHIPRYDEPLERVGGENNAFTNSDYTNYYLTIPGHNLETAFWLESDRMLDLAFSEKSLEVQREVVVEEFNQNYLNQPYGDAWLQLRPLAYKQHPYRWATIGIEPRHIEEASMDDVRSFYRRFYNPCNAIMVLAGNVSTEEIKNLSEKWFGPIPAGQPYHRNLGREPQQTEARFLKLKRNVPYDALYKAWHMCGRNDNEFLATDLLSDILSAGQSGRLYQRLVKELQLFSDLSAYITGDIDPGLFVITGKLMKGKGFEEAEKAIEEEIEKLRNELVTERELQKVKNRMEAMLEFNEMRVLDKAMNLAYYELLGDAGTINTLLDSYRQVSAHEMQSAARTVFTTVNCSTLYIEAES